MSRSYISLWIEKQFLRSRRLLRRRTISEGSHRQAPADKGREGPGERSSAMRVVPILMLSALLGALGWIFRYETLIVRGTTSGARIVERNRFTGQIRMTIYRHDEVYVLYPDSVRE